MSRAHPRSASGQALIELMLGAGLVVLIVSGIFAFGIALAARAVLAHALEEKIVCLRSVAPKAECERQFDVLLALAPGEIRVVSLRKSGEALRGKFIWKFLRFEKELRIDENSPLSE